MDETPELTQKQRVMICQNNSCLERGSKQVLEAFQTANLPPHIKAVGCDCQGQCNLGPTVRVVPEETWYSRVQAEDVSAIVEDHLKGGNRVMAKLHPRIHPRYAF
ncbi:(2Fe-2S) ferredoxin domain-containing protein [Lusitaniella coriacea LEGE 07157]|uniref:(2Fe-2S) ferredoxin domain-containing protein n=1 Tax=Lusitaniella coriacea LEGE 07157 TaxID=945747 RepID=A0A8J7DW09_9CYAN|nr:(2Fe-2S) ferredoxin domain-containing protein [Lusitaniella coriacea]MBE9116152.1 (2Fe-2S) ferredoxin domain-containing protein [Lusitaniella coriacea LEGE 07157]